MKKYFLELFGTFALVLVGCGAAAIGGNTPGFVGIALAFGLTLAAMAYCVGPVSGCHINPAVSLGFFAAGRLGGKDLAGYVLAQIVGAIGAAWVLLMIAENKVGGYNLAAQGLGQTGWGAGYTGEYGQTAAVLFEFIATLLFVTVILVITSTEGSRSEGPKETAGLIIGLTLATMILLGLNITGGSLNPARSLGPALMVGGKAMQQIWLFLTVPSLGGLAGGLLSRLIVAENPENELHQASRLKVQHQ